MRVRTKQKMIKALMKTDRYFHKDELQSKKKSKVIELFNAYFPKEKVKRYK